MKSDLSLIALYFIQALRFCFTDFKAAEFIHIGLGSAGLMELVEIYLSINCNIMEWNREGLRDINV